MSICFCKKYDSEKLKGNTCVLLYCKNRKMYWFGKQTSITSERYVGCICNCHDNYKLERLVKNTYFYFNKYDKIKSTLKVYFINEKDFDKIIGKIKDEKSFKRLVGMLVEF